MTAPNGLDSLPEMVAAGYRLLMADWDDYPGDIICKQHVEEINGHQVRRVEILQADDRVKIAGPMLRRLERLPFAPSVVVICDELDGRQFYYRQVGWNYTRDGVDYWGAFKLIHVSPSGTGQEITDAQACDVAAASGWIEDTPEARAAYLTDKE